MRGRRSKRRISKGRTAKRRTAARRPKFISRAILNTAAFLSAATFISSCTIYKSSDRDFFDSNGVAGAPVAQSLKPETANCHRLTETSASVADADSIRIHRLEDGRAQVDIKAHASGASTSTAQAECQFIYRLADRATGTANDDDRELERSSRSLVERYLAGFDL